MPKTTRAKGSKRKAAQKSTAKRKITRAYILSLFKKHSAKAKTKAIQPKAMLLAAAAPAAPPDPLGTCTITGQGATVIKHNVTRKVCCAVASDSGGTCNWVQNN